MELELEFYLLDRQLHNIGEIIRKYEIILSGDSHKGTNLPLTWEPPIKLDIVQILTVNNSATGMQYETILLKGYHNNNNTISTDNTINIDE